MTSLQKQDLNIFSDHSVISKELCNGSSHDMIFLTSSPSNSPFWLINALIETQVLGVPYSLNTESTYSNNLKSSRGVSIGSFIHDAKHFTNALSKLKIPPDAYNIFDLLTDFVLKTITKPRAKVLSDLVNLFPHNPSSVIILEQPEMLLFLLEGLTSEELHQKFIMPLMRKCGLLIISTTLNTSNEELNTRSRDAIELTRFTVGCFYKSIAVLSLRPLDTGRASDVTGSLSITRGGITASHIPAHVVENEYLYLNQRESVKLFYR